MLEPWLVYVLIFVLVFLAVHLGQIGLGPILHTRRLTTARLEALDRSDRSSSELEVRKKGATGLGTSALVARLDTLILQSGTRLSPATLAIVLAAVWLLLFITLPFLSTMLFRLTASGIGAAFLVGAYLRIKRARRLARFGDQLPDVIDVIVRSLRAGHPLPVSLSLVAREMPEPAGREFAILVDEVSYGRDISGALEGLHKRVGYPDLKFMVASIAIAQQTGGNLSEILARLSRMLRDRHRLRRKVKALAAEGRFSGYALSALPVILFAIINLVSPSYYSDFWDSSARTTLLVLSILLLFLGNLTIYKMVNFKV